MRPYPAAALLASVVIATGCADSGQRAGTTVTPDTGGTAVVGLRTDLDAANFLVSGDAIMHEVLRYLLFLPLVQYDSALGYRPALAQSYELQGDTSVLFRLRRDVYWHDGVHTTAHDVAFTFVRAADPETAFPNADWLIGWGVPQVIDSFTIRFPLVPMADPLASVAMFPIMPRHLLEPIRPAEMLSAEFNKKPVGNGPFRFVEYRANDRWVLEANRSFSPSLGGRPYLNRLILRVIPDNTALVAELRAGNVDLAFNVPVEHYQQLEQDSMMRGIVRPTRKYAIIPWNGRRAPLNDARVRRALNMAIDRREIINVLRAGHGTPIDGPIGRYHWAYDPELPALPFNQDSARALLAAGGLRDRDNDQYLDRPDGRAWTVDLKIPANQQVSRDVAEMIRSDLQQVGVRVSVKPVDHATINGDLLSSRRNFDAALIGWE
ncbi:MAG TPA: ABC transporter substrate-binding protein, partial [Longimicrobiales bacterium]|nr:ABC transporter substrate-binding protein [Longimicrobiales bacterium]